MEMANSKPRGPLARNRSFDRADVNGKSTTRRRGPAAILGTDATGGTVKLRGQTFKVAKNCGRRWVAPKDEGEVQWNPASGGVAPVSSGRRKW